MGYYTTGSGKKNPAKFSDTRSAGLMGCASAALVSGQKQGGKIQTCRNFLHDPVQLV